MKKMSNRARMFLSKAREAANKAIVDLLKHGVDVHSWDDEGNLKTLHADSDEAKERIAKDMLADLSRHYKEPVMPVSKYCEALRTWVECIQENNTNPELKEQDTFMQGENYHTHLESIMIDIEKSGLLWRLIYDGQKKRTKMCPEHKGHMNTGMWCGIGECEHGCEGTGWLKDEGS